MLLDMKAQKIVSSVDNLDSAVNNSVGSHTYNQVNLCSKSFSHMWLWCMCIRGFFLFFFHTIDDLVLIDELI